jgi:hypothetical protein
MTIHEATIAQGESGCDVHDGARFVFCPCGWKPEFWDVCIMTNGAFGWSTMAASDVAAVDEMLAEFAERHHLMDDEHGAVRIAGAFLTRRRHSFVGRLEDSRVVIVAATGDGRWAPVWNTEDADIRCPIVEPRERVSDVIRAVSRTTGTAFK